MLRTHFVVVTLIVGLLAAACGGGEGKAPDEQAEDVRSETATTSSMATTTRAFAETWGAGWLRVPEWGSRPCWDR